jgi:hypothetical protein
MPGTFGVLPTAAALSRPTLVPTPTPTSAGSSAGNYTYFGNLTNSSLLNYILGGVGIDSYSSDGNSTGNYTGNSTNTTYNTNTTPQLPWQSYVTDDGITVPYYSTGFLNEEGQMNITYAVIIQHGFLRNANNYFCDAYDALVNATRAYFNSTGSSGDPQFDPNLRTLNNTIIVAPQFVSPGDVCWPLDGLPTIVDLSDYESTCGLPIWSIDEWVTGESSLNPVYSFAYGNGTFVYSYDIFNFIISRLANPSFFPNLKYITIFGFSAGAQALQRYLIYPRYSMNSSIEVNWALSDPSSFAYFDDLRPFTNGSAGFGIPDQSWLPDQWEVRLL